MSCLDFGKELERIQGRVQDAVGKFQSETYTIDERAKEGGYFVDISSVCSLFSAISISQGVANTGCQLLAGPKGWFPSTNRSAFSVSMY